MITARIIGSNGHELKINGEGELTATLHTHPPREEKVESFPFRAYFRNSSESNDMRINGLTDPDDFYISADAEYDYFIKVISVKLADAGAKFNLFGALAALTNGVKFSWSNLKTGELIIHDGIKDNLEWFRLSNQVPTITDLSGGGADSIVVYIDLAVIFGTPWGVRLTKGTKDQLSFSVRDNLSAGLDEFNIIAYGVKI